MDDPHRQTIKEVARALADRLTFYQEMGVDSWKQTTLPVIAPSSLSPMPASTRPVSVHATSKPPMPASTEDPISLHPASNPDATSALAAVRAELGDCRRCKLCDGRTNIVFGVGDPNAALMFVGEAPGEDEDRQGVPFIGRAGQLLTKMIVAMGLSRETVYIANIVKCRPPSNRNPQPDEITTCSPFLYQQIQAIRPKIICALGTFSAQTLLGVQTPISALRGHFHPLPQFPDTIRVMPTYHPAYLLRSPGEKKKVWDDLQKIMAELHLTEPHNPPVAD